LINLLEVSFNIVLGDTLCSFSLSLDVLIMLLLALSVYVFLANNEKLLGAPPVIF